MGTRKFKPDTFTAEQVRRLLKGLNWSEAELADHCGVAFVTARRWRFTGASRPAVVRALRKLQSEGPPKAVVA